jgi:hypothetical protein
VRRDNDARVDVQRKAGLIIHSGRKLLREGVLRGGTLWGHGACAAACSAPWHLPYIMPPPAAAPPRPAANPTKDMKAEWQKQALEK